MSITETLIGKNMKAHPEALGLYISLDEMYIAQSTRKEGGVMLESLLRIPIAPVDPSKLKPLELNEEFFGEENWLEALTKVAAKKKWNQQKVVVSLSPSFSLLRHFVIPTMIERKHWKEAIPLQARKYIHFPFDKTMYAYHVYEFETAATKQKRLGVIFSMTTKVIVEKLEKGLKSVGLDPIAIEVSALSLSRAFSENDKEIVDDSGRIYSFFGTEEASFVFINKQAPVLLREMDISSTSPVERRRFEIVNYTEFIAKQLERDPFEEAVIMGQNTDMWTPLLEADSKKPVRKWDLSEVYGIDTKSSGEIASIGASMKFYDQKGPDLDFIKRTRLSDYEYNAGLMFWKIAGLVAIILLLWTAKLWWGVYADGQRLKKLRAQNKALLPDFQGLSAQQIQNNLARVKSQNATLESLLNRSYATPFLVDLVNAIPEQVWISKLTYKENFPRVADSRSVELEGSIQTGNSEQDLAIGRKFEKQLLGMPSIQEICGDRGNLQYRDLALLGNASSGRRSSNGRNKETSFVFTCKKGNK